MSEDREVIRRKLEKNNLTAVWIINRLADAGVNTDKTEFSSVINGTRVGPKAKTIITTSLSILEVYEKAMNQVRK